MLSIELPMCSSCLDMWRIMSMTDSIWHSRFSECMGYAWQGGARMPKKKHIHKRVYTCL